MVLRGVHEKTAIAVTDKKAACEIEGTAHAIANKKACQEATDKAVLI